jgi:hypothetical protein
MGKIIAVLVLFILGGLMVLCTKTMVRFQVWSQRVLMGAQYTPSQRTYTMMRIVGVLLIILGIIVLTIVHK